MAGLANGSLTHKAHFSIHLVESSSIAMTISQQTVLSTVMKQSLSVNGSRAHSKMAMQIQNNQVTAQSS
jgi:hypothetical protein